MEQLSAALSARGQTLAEQFLNQRVVSGRGLHLARGSALESAMRTYVQQHWSRSPSASQESDEELPALSQESLTRIIKKARQSKDK